MKRLFSELQFALHEMARLFVPAPGRPQAPQIIIITNDGYLDPP